LGLVIPKRVTCSPEKSKKHWKRKEKKEKELSIAGWDRDVVRELKAIR
jgi:hypothetical protein